MGIPGKKSSNVMDRLHVFHSINLYNIYRLSRPRATKKTGNISDSIQPVAVIYGHLAGGPCLQPHSLFLVR